MTPDMLTLRRAVRSRIARDHGDRLIDREVVAALVAEIAPVLELRLREQVIDSVLADVHGMGDIDALLRDPLVTDVMVVGGKGVWIERSGEMVLLDIDIDDSEIERLIERAVSPLGLHVDRASPMVDARLPDGSRVHAVLPPIAVDGPCLTIRRFGARPIQLERMASPPICRALREAIADRRNIVVSGGTGVGKTTLLNALAAEFAPAERIITIEDTAELRIRHRHVVRLESRPPNAEGAGEITLRQLVRNALRMRPDRLIVGEVRGGETFDMLQAMNTGHSGSLSTCHANSATGALIRLETMVLLADIGMNIAAVRQLITSAVDLIVHVVRDHEGNRHVADLAEVVTASDGRLQARSMHRR